ncbi:MAG: Glu/Leu/Phe/Val dehydrogenase dimerization domain-containing protein [Nannocystaceae bacterium]
MEVIRVEDAEAGLLAFIAMDAQRRWPAFGGVRRVRYVDEGAAVSDARRLARAMTHKLSIARLPAVGAKTVIMDRPGLVRAKGYACLGRRIEALGGRYVCGPDVGTGGDELALLRRQTRHVNPAGNDAGRATARGVLAAIRGLCAVRFGSNQVRDLSFGIEGLGSVGMAVAKELVASGASVSATDLQAGCVAEARREGITHLSGDSLWTGAWDVLVPCAMGDCLSAARVERLRVRGVCGSANNQLRHEGLASVLQRRGVLWVPDVVASAGAVIEGVLTVAGGRTAETLRAVAERIDHIEVTTRVLLSDSMQRDESPLDGVQRQICGDRGR